MRNLAKEIMEATKTSFIDYNVESVEDLRPRLLYNDTRKGKTVLANIEKELNNCNSFWFSVAFVTKSGLIVLKNTLKELSEKSIGGKILTTDYLEFNEPGALRELLQFENLEVRVFTEEHFHTKGYMFEKEGVHTFIVGSSNLTQTALKLNKEWNIKVTSMEQGELIKDTNEEFNSMWNGANLLTANWINEYEQRYIKRKNEKDSSKIERILTHTLMPNKMQVEATRALSKLRDEGKEKALLISATGTGKTYLSAFDVRNSKPSKLLFLVHREQILKQALESFKDVLGEGKSMGLLSGNSKDTNADYLFSTIQMMSKESIYSQFTPHYFDYIILDEVHRAGAASYLKILNYYKPKFILGMTATPERTDGFNIFELFDYNIAYEIRLQQAMKENMLCPFHYFGITELTVDGEVIDDMTNFTKLVSAVRVDNVIDKIKFYGYSGNRVKGLIFCSKKEEARELSRLFNQRGYQTIALCSDSSPEQRENEIVRLEQKDRENGLDYIFTVDIFNEGVDIPAVNQIVMLRPTESAIIFIQQLGRGLRKQEDKEYVVVIDFIGNYSKNFLIPLALSGDRTFNKDTIRNYVAEGNRIIPGCSTVNFDKISRERIYESINVTNFTTLKFLKDEYVNLKNTLGRIPTLMDFYKSGAVDPVLFIEYSKNYYNFIKKVEKEYTEELSEKENAMLEYISMNIANGKRPHELLILEKLFDYESVSVDSVSIELLERYNITDDIASIYNAFALLEGKNIAMKSEANRYMEYQFVESIEKGRLRRCIAFYEGINNKQFLDFVRDIVEYGLAVYADKYVERYHNTNLVLYKKYSRKDVCRLLNWDKDESGTINGYRVKHNTCPIFVTYKKGEDISESTKYEDTFVNKDVFSWMTRHGLTVEKSKEVKAIMDYEKSGLTIHLFIKKRDSEGKDFYYMGEMYPIKDSVRNTTITNEGKELPIVNILFKLKNQVQDDIYEYITEE